MKKTTSLLLVVCWLFLFATALSVTGYYLYCEVCPSANIALAQWCMISGGVGGLLYCMRAVYLNYSYRNDWQQIWLPWYFLRPFVSILTGGISMLFLKASLLLLDSEKESNGTFGFLAFAFIAGLNVDNFIRKLEELAETTWGISKSRTSKEEEISGSDTYPNAAQATSYDTLPIEKQFDLAQQWIQENSTIFKTQYPEITGISASRKISDGQILEIVAVVFQVKTKTAAAQLFPGILAYNGFAIPTDVEEADFASPQNITIASGISRSDDKEHGTLGTPVMKDGELHFMSCYHVYCNEELSKGEFQIKDAKNLSLVSPPYIEDPFSPIAGYVTDGHLNEWLDVAFMKPIVPISPKYGEIPGPTVLRPLKRDEENKIYLQFKGNGSKKVRKGMLRDIYLSEKYINYKGKKQHCLKGLIKIDRCAKAGDSGAAVCDFEGRYVGFVVASDDNFTYILSAHTIEFKTQYSIIQNNQI